MGVTIFPKIIITIAKTINIQNKYNNNKFINNNKITMVN